MSTMLTARPPASAAEAGAWPAEAELRPWRGLDTPPPYALGTLPYGPALGLPGLGEGPAPTDAWCAGTPQASGQHGALHWQHDGHWLWGELDLPEQAGLSATVLQAYGALFETLRHTGFVHPLRLWNYLADIHGDDAGLERYRRFNAARQQAFLDAGWPAFEGAPAACCLGTAPGQPLRLRVLAARQAPLPLENPRQVSAYHYPSTYGPKAPTFSRATLAHAGGGRQVLLVSGTASIVGHLSVHPGDLAAQVDETLRNLQALLDAAAATGVAALRLAELSLTAYLRHPADAAPLRARLAQCLGADSHAVRTLVLLQAQVCRDDLLVEIEAHAETSPLPAGAHT